jgi:hypothetical protein
MEIRTPVLTLKGSRPSPLDDGGVAAALCRKWADCNTRRGEGQAKRRALPLCDARGRRIGGGLQDWGDGREEAGRLPRGVFARGFVGLPASGFNSMLNQEIDFSS